MSWHGPSAPRVEGIATKSLVVASCASKPASTASRILCLMSLSIIALILPVRLFRCCQIKAHFAGTCRGRTAFRIAAVSLDSGARFCAAWRHEMAGKFRGCLILLALVLSGSPAHAMMDQVGREQDIVNLRLGQRVQVDDGTCPQGQIKEVSGARMGQNGVERAHKCILTMSRSEEHTSELQSQSNLVCRLLL